MPATDQVPERFELGTLPYELMAGTTAAVDFLASLGDGRGPSRAGCGRRYAAIEEYEDGLRERLEEGLARAAGRRALAGEAADADGAGDVRRTPTPRDVSVALAERDINAPAGNFYAWEPSHHLGLGEDGGLRIGLAPYTTEDEIDRLLAALGEVLAT